MMKPVALRLIVIDAISFQLLWFIAVQGNDLFAAIAAVAHIALYQFMRAVTRAQWCFIAAVALTGGLIDTLIGTTGIIAFHGTLTISVHDWTWQIAPLWLWCLWLGFATTLLRSLSLLNHRPILAALIGSVAGPLSYWAGATLSGSIFMRPLVHVIIFEAVMWAVLLPALLYITRAVTNTSEGEGDAHAQRLAQR
ncbi:MAG: DUF2878 domain-containing protein [Spongiibacteraceae bacterium]